MVEVTTEEYERYRDVTLRPGVAFLLLCLRNRKPLCYALLSPCFGI